MLNYHTAAACSPTRAMLLSGTDAHLGGLGCLIEYKAQKDGAQRWNGKEGYEGYLNRKIAPLSEVLQDQGYNTILSGKVRSLMFKLKVVAPRHATRRRTVGSRFREELHHVARLLQPLRLGTSARVGRQRLEAWRPACARRGRHSSSPATQQERVRFLFLRTLRRQVHRVRRSAEQGQAILWLPCLHSASLADPV